MNLTNFLINKKREIILIIFLATILVIILGCLFLPELFYDQWIWKFYWGPVVADANPNISIVTYNGIQAREGYTIISEITYGLILIFSLFGIYKLLKKLEIKIDWLFFLALLPYIIFGPVTRVLEDAGYFSPPIVYWFISPLIYLQIASYALLFLFLGYIVKKKIKKPWLTVNKVVFTGGFVILIPFMYLIFSWMLGYQWSASNGVRFDILILILLLVSFITFLVYIISRFFQKNEIIRVYKNPMNLSLIFGHMMDGLTSYFSIFDPLNMGLPVYIDKHPASNFLMEIWPISFPIVKFILIIIVIYVIDILYKKEFKKYQNLVGLLKIGIFILGFSPGLRDLLRVSMGV